MQFLPILPSHFTLTPNPAAATTDWGDVDAWASPKCPAQYKATMLIEVFAQGNQSQLNRAIQQHLKQTDHHDVAFGQDVRDILARHDLMLIQNPDRSVAMLVKDDRRAHVEGALQTSLPPALVDIVHQYDAQFEFREKNDAGMIEILRSGSVDLKSQILASASAVGAVGHLNTLLEHVGAAGINLSGCDLRNMNLAGIYLFRANLENAKLQNTILTRAEMSGADLRNVNLDNATLTYAKMWNADFSRASCIGTDFSDARLDSAIFVHTNMQGASLERTDLVEAEIFSSNFDEVNLSQASLGILFCEDTTLRKINLGAAGVDALSQVRLSGNITVTLSQKDVDTLQKINGDGVTFHIQDGSAVAKETVTASDLSKKISGLDED